MAAEIPPELLLPELPALLPELPELLLELPELLPEEVAPPRLPVTARSPPALPMDETFCAAAEAVRAAAEAAAADAARAAVWDRVDVVPVTLEAMLRAAWVTLDRMLFLSAMVF